MTIWRAPQPVEIDKKLREDFRRLLKESGVSTDEIDTMTASLFRSVAAQISDIYEQAAESIPRAVLEELIEGLGMREPRARAAQTVVRFSLKKGRERIKERTELIAETAAREKLTFAVDSTIEVSGARIAMAAIYQDGQLRLHRGTPLSKELESARPSYEAAPASLGESPALFVAIDHEHDGFLGLHGFYLETAPGGRDLARHFEREVWCLLDAEGEINAAGLMRPRSRNAGVRRLEWLMENASDEPEESYSLPQGFYGGKVFVLPEIPKERRFVSRLPRGMEEPLRKTFAQAKEKSELFKQPRAWLRIGLPANASHAAEDLIRIVLHATTASNLETLDQTINFAEDGRVIPFISGNARPRHLVKTISIRGERGSEYLKDADPGADENIGRYQMRQGNLTIEPARTERGEMDASVNIRLLFSNGLLGNQVGVGGIRSFLNPAAQHSMDVKNLTAAVGGDAGDGVIELKNRFVENLLSHDRLVTRADLEAMVRRFEPKIRRIRTSSALESNPDGLQRVQRISITLQRSDFVSPDEESAILRRELEAFLQERSLLGIIVRVSVDWKA